MQRNASLLSLLALTTFAAVPVQAQWSTASLSEARMQAAGVTVDGLALFAGGRDGNVTSAVVDIYDAAGDRWSQDSLSSARALVAATAVGHLALFAGGSPTLFTDSQDVDVFDAQTWSWLPLGTLSLARRDMAATTVGTKAIFAGGGFVNGAPMASDRVDIYDASVGLPSDPAAWTTATLSEARLGMAAATVGDFALFAGGVTDAMGTSSLRVDVYDSSTDTWSQASLSQERQLGAPASAVAGTRAFFAGGRVSVNPPVTSDVIDIYDASVGLPDDPAAWTTATLSQARGFLSATALGNTVLFAGGTGSPTVFLDVVDVMNAGTGAFGPPMQLSVGRSDLAATSVAGMALFAGGYDGVGASAVVDMYEPVGLNYCAALNNSTGCAATISAEGSSSIAANDLELSAVCVPNQPFLFFHAAQQLELPFGDGLRCAGVDLVRLPPGLATGNVAQTTVDLPSANITSPGVRNFQCWFRDPAAAGSGFNTSDAMEITFVP